MTQFNKYAIFRGYLFKQDSMVIHIHIKQALIDIEGQIGFASVERDYNNFLYCSFFRLAIINTLMQGAPIAEDLYVVESIIGKKMIEGKLYYKVKWQGYPESDSTWEKLSHLRYVAEMVKDFEKTISTDSSADSHQGVLISNDPSIENCRQGTLEKSSKPVLTRSALKLLRKEKRAKSLKEKEDRKLFKKEAKRLKKMRKEKGQSSLKPRISETEGAEKAVADEQRVVTKGEEDYQPVEMNIRLIVAEDDSDIRDYVVEYPNGNAKVFNTCQMFYAHPVEFVGYLEKRALSKTKK